jgi:hypothetical protein
MVTKKKQKSNDKGPKVKARDLKLKKETVKELTGSETDKVQGGAVPHSYSICDVCPRLP